MNFFAHTFIILLLKKKVPNNMVKGTFGKISPKYYQILRKKVMKLLRFLEDLDTFLAFFF